MIIEESILIKADLKEVWDTFANLTCWEGWNTIIRDVESEVKYIETGCRLICNFRPFFFPINVAIHVKEVKSSESISWRVEKPGLLAEHIFYFKKIKDGVLVTSKETFSGFLVRNAKFIVPKQKIISLTKTFLNDLKKASERSNV